MRPKPRTTPHRTALPHPEKRLEQLIKEEKKSTWDMGTIGFYISILSFVIGGYAAWATAKQADYAKTALTAAEVNSSFKDFIKSWSRLCNTMDTSDGYMMFETNAPAQGERLIMLARDFGYTFAPFDYEPYKANVVKAIAEVGENYDTLSLWVSDEQLRGMNFEAIMRNLLIMSRVDPTGNEAIRYQSVFMQTGYCKFWKPQFQQWYSAGFHPLRMIDYNEVELGIRTSPTGRLDNDYIKAARVRQ